MDRSWFRARPPLVADWWKRNVSVAKEHPTSSFNLKLGIFWRLHIVQLETIQFLCNNLSEAETKIDVVWEDSIQAYEVDSVVSDWFSDYWFQLVWFTCPKKVTEKWRLNMQLRKLILIFFGCISFLLIGQSSLDDLNSVWRKHCWWIGHLILFYWRWSYEEESWKEFLQ
jgi:hypothetical protein